MVAPNGSEKQLRNDSSDNKLSKAELNSSWEKSMQSSVIKDRQMKRAASNCQADLKGTFEMSQ